MLTLRLILVLVYTTQVTLSSWSAILSPWLFEGEYFLLITSELPNQGMWKVLLTCVLNTIKNYCTFPGWLVSLYKEKMFLSFKINWSRTLNTATFLSTFILLAPSIYIIFSRRTKYFHCAISSDWIFLAIKPFHIQWSNLKCYTDNSHH